VPLGSVVEEVIETGAGEVGELEVAIVMLRAAEAVCPLASVTTKVNVLVPAFAGVPDKTPDALKPRPVLQDPEQLLIAQL
jgi:hypothetical protein